MKKKRNYDIRVKQTRVFLDDYLVIKGLSRQAGISMAEALHKIITRDWAMARSHEILTPVTTARSMPVAIARRRSTPVTTSFSIEVENVTNGHR